ncbi:hypothetical protein DFH07DRAFT_973420 [Mycena maculata]|uniref:Late embryogenesis abundant protein n=1 Tax=Mycena maculata TaxID=230809 RepID=A0AAD7HEL2_9AGAR|nr:hypothetical protein DFH07DRAFT_973420 [Mycena maculata]
MTILHLASRARPLAPRLTAIRTRAYAQAAPPPPPPAAEKKSAGNSTLYLIGAALAAGGAYYFYTSNPERVDELKHKANAEEGLAARGIKDAKDNVVAAGQDRLAAARGTVSGSLKDAKDIRDRVVAGADERAHQVAADATGVYNSAKGSAQQGLASARSSTESLYRDARETAEEKKDEAKAGWFSWLGWGKAEGKEKFAEAKETLEAGKARAAQEGSKAVGDVQKKLDKHT